MSVGSLLRTSYLLYFSQPAAERTLYKAARAKPIRSIVELGLGQMARTLRLFELVSRRADEPLRYTGIDLFEARPSGQPQLSLKQAHAKLRATQARVQLVPGDPATALRRVANSLAETDLLLISADQDRESLALAWQWIPRMLTPSSQIYLEESDRAASGGRKPSEPTRWRLVPPAEAQRLATCAAKSHRRAA